MYSCSWNTISQLQSVTCHIGSHSITCYLTQVNTSRLHPSWSGWYSIYLPQRDGRLSWPRWLFQMRTGDAPESWFNEWTCRCCLRWHHLWETGLERAIAKAITLTFYSHIFVFFVLRTTPPSGRDVCTVFACVTVGSTWSRCDLWWMTRSMNGCSSWWVSLRRESVLDCRNIWCWSRGGRLIT